MNEAGDNAASRIVVGQGVIEWVSERASMTFSEASAGIGLQKGGKIVAGVVYVDWNRRNVYAHHAIEGRITRRYLWTILDYPFNQLKVERVTGIIPEGYKKAERFAKHLGFSLETRLKDAHPSGDLLVYVVRRRDAERWLNVDLYRNRRLLAA